MGDVIVNSYIDTLMQECNFLTGENREKKILDWIVTGNLVMKYKAWFVAILFLQINHTHYL